MGGNIIRLHNPDGGDHVAVHFPAKEPTAPTLVYFHGNADQIGLGAAYIGRRFADKFNMGFYGVDYPGYGLSGGSPSEKSIAESSSQLLAHLCSANGLRVPQERIILMGQSIGCAVAIEMAVRGFGA